VCLTKHCSIKMFGKWTWTSTLPWPGNQLEVNGQLHDPAALPSALADHVLVGQGARCAPERLWTIWPYQDLNFAPSGVQPVSVAIQTALQRLISVIIQPALPLFTSVTIQTTLQPLTLLTVSQHKGSSGRSIKWLGVDPIRKRTNNTWQAYGLLVAGTTMGSEWQRILTLGFPSATDYIDYQRGD
jgi:hypothetical protein